MFRTTTIATLAALALANTAAAQSTSEERTFGATCFDTEQARNTLSEKYGEQIAVVGIVNDKAILEIQANHDSGSWTLMMTGTDGVSCVIAEGMFFSTIPPKPAGELN